MARPTTQLLRAAASVILVVVVAMSAAPATGARRRVPVTVPPPPPAVGITVYCTEAHGVRAGETCGSVARDARIPAPRFVELNPNVTCGALFLGQWLCVRGVEVA